MEAKSGSGDKINKKSTPIIDKSQENFFWSFRTSLAKAVVHEKNSTTWEFGKEALSATETPGTMDLGIVGIKTKKDDCCPRSTPFEEPFPEEQGKGFSALSRRSPARGRSSITILGGAKRTLGWSKK
jgi:hypothetical protein